MNKTNRGRDKFTAVAAFVSSCHVVDNELLNGDGDFYVRYFAGKSPVLYVRICGGNHRNAPTEIFNLSVEKHSVTIRIAIPFLVDVTFESGLNLSVSERCDATRRCRGYLWPADNNLCVPVLIGTRKYAQNWRENNLSDRLSVYNIK